MKFIHKVEMEENVTHIDCKIEVRYWEDGTVNGIEDTDGTLIPMRFGDILEWKITLETGQINDWPQGTTASVHYKVCDGGTYFLINESGRAVATVENGYVPDMLCPKDKGYGDYVIMDIDDSGFIQGWKADLSYFNTQEEE
jgi:hypothetical protein